MLESAFYFYKPPQSKSDGWGGAPEASERMISHSFSGLLKREQVDESQHSLLAIALQTAAGGIPTSHVGTGTGGSSSDLPWNDNDKDKYQRPKSKGWR